MQTNELDEHRQSWMQGGCNNITFDNLTGIVPPDYDWGTQTSSGTTYRWNDGTDHSKDKQLADLYGSWAEPQKPKPSKHKEQPMENLYQVIVVSKDRDILLDAKVVALDVDEAKFQVDIHATLKEKGLKPKDVTILANDIGEVKVRKEVQKVKVVDKEEE